MGCCSIGTGQEAVVFFIFFNFYSNLLMTAMYIAKEKKIEISNHVSLLRFASELLVLTNS